MKNKIILLLLVALSVPVSSEKMCEVNEEVEPDMRIPESHFTKERAQEAVGKISAIVSGSDSKYEWITVPNCQKVIEGYILRRDALEAKGALKEYKVSQFCSFMETSAWWYD